MILESCPLPVSPPWLADAIGVGIKPQWFLHHQGVTSATEMSRQQSKHFRVKTGLWDQISLSPVLDFCT